MNNRLAGVTGILLGPGLIDRNGKPLQADKPKEPEVRRAMVDERTGEVLEVVTELTTEEEKQRAALMVKMKTYAAKFLKRHPNTSAERLKRIVCKKFNVKLT